MILRFNQFNESNEIGSPLLSLQDNTDHQLIDLIEREVKPGSKILEISCGNASDSLYLQELGYQITCTEYNSKYVKNAKDLGLDCLLHDTKSKFPFRDKEFDLVYSRLGLHYFTPKELESIFTEINRISKKILITVKVVDDIKTGKVILTPDVWKEIISKHFQIKKFEIKEGLLYGSQSGWIEILADSIEPKLEKIDVERFEISPCIQVMEHELEQWQEFHKLEKFSDKEMDDIEDILKDFNVVCSSSGISYKYESKQKANRPKVKLDMNPPIIPTIKVSGIIRKMADEYYRITLSEEVYRSRRNSFDHEVEYHICDQIEGLKFFKKYLENKIKYLKKDLSINESAENSFPKEISHSEGLSFERKSKKIQFSDYQINEIKKLIPENYQLHIQQGGGWYDPEKKLYKTSITIHKNSLFRIAITALEDEYFTIQKVREGKLSDDWWLADGFEQLITWLKWRY